jgi:prophage regulatory protein
MTSTSSPSLRPKQAAAFLGISPATLWRWTKLRKDEGFPQPARLGPRTTVFVEEHLASFRDKQREAE